MESFVLFVITVSAWIALGSWGASILTRKNYLSADRPREAHRSDIVRRMGLPSVSAQMVLAFLGPSC